MKRKPNRPHWSVTKNGKILFSGSMYECLFYVARLYPNDSIEDVIDRKVSIKRYSATRNKKMIARTAKKLEREVSLA